MKVGRIVRLAALAAALALTGCRTWCERYNAQPAYAGNCGCYQPQPCCAPASNYPVQAQPCAPAAPNWSVPVAPH